MSLEIHDGLKQKRIDAVVKKFWTFAQTYQLAAPHERSVWYIMDEVGSAINHADEANMICIPFMFLNPQDGGGALFPCSVAYPIKQIGQGEQLTRNYAPLELRDDELAYKAYLWAFPWFRDDVAIEDLLKKAYQVYLVIPL